MRNELSPFDDNSESSDKEDKGSVREEKRWVPPPPLISAERPPGLLPHLLESLEDDDEDDDEDGGSKQSSQESVTPEVELPEGFVQAESDPVIGVTEVEALPITNTELPALESEQMPESVEPPAYGEFEDSGILRFSRENGGVGHEFIAPDRDDDEVPTQHSPAPVAGRFPNVAPSLPQAEARPFDAPEYQDAEPPQAQNRYALSQSWNTAPSSVITAEQHRTEIKETQESSEKRGLRRGLVAGFITGYVLKAYLANRKHERYEKAAKKQLNERDEKITYMQREQQKLGEHLKARTEELLSRQEQVRKNQPARFEKPVVKPVAEALPPVKTAEVGQIFDQEGNEITLQPGWHVERSSGGYSAVLDEHNRVVHNAIHYGEAFKRDQKREQISDDLFASMGGGVSASGSTDSGFGAIPPQTPGQLPDMQYGPPANVPTVDLKHRLPKPRNQIVTVAASPWLWTAVAILIIIYFVAALA